MSKPLSGSSSERIPNRELSVDRLAILKIFGIEDRASSFAGGGNHQGVIDPEAVLLRNLERRFVHVHGEGEGGRAQNAESIERFPHVTPRHHYLSGGWPGLSERVSFEGGGWPGLGVGNGFAGAPSVAPRDGWCF
jgi:hypothetical protein